MWTSQKTLTTKKMAKTCSSFTILDPDHHPDDTLKAFNEFIQAFKLRYAATFPDPLKVSLDIAIETWKLTQEDDTKPKIQQYGWIREE